MIVCLCNAISEAKIREVIRTGATSVREVQKRCGAGTDCGSCVMVIEQMVHQATGPQQSSFEGISPCRKDSQEK